MQPHSMPCNSWSSPVTLAKPTNNLHGQHLLCYGMYSAIPLNVFKIMGPNTFQFNKEWKRWGQNGVPSSGWWGKLGVVIRRIPCYHVRNAFGNSVVAQARHNTIKERYTWGDGESVLGHLKAGLTVVEAEWWTSDLLHCSRKRKGRNLGMDDRGGIYRGWRVIWYEHFML